MNNEAINEIDELKKLGVEQIVADTYISHDTIKAIFDKDFAFFGNKAKALRFIKILNSTYDYTLKVWLDEYLQYRKDNNILDEGASSTTSASINTEYTKHEAQTYAPYISIGIAIIVILIVVAFSSFEDSEKTIEPDGVNENTNVEQLENVLSQKASEQTLSVVSLKKNRHQRYQQNTQEDINSELNPEVSEILNMDIVIDLNQSILEIQRNDILITTNLGRIWVGIIDLDTYSKKSDIIEDSKTFPVYDNTIFITGHGHLTLESGENQYNLANGGKQYFYYKDGRFVKLKRIEYLYLNKGIEW